MALIRHPQAASSISSYRAKLMSKLLNALLTVLLLLSNISGAVQAQPSDPGLSLEYKASVKLVYKAQQSVFLLKGINAQLEEERNRNLVTHSRSILEILSSSNRPINYTGTIDPDQSSVTTDLASIVADPSVGVEITVTLKDASGQVIADAPVEIQVTGDDNFVNGNPIDLNRVSIGNTDANGSVSATLASTRAEIKSITVFGDQIQLSSVITVQVLPGVPSYARSFYDIGKYYVIADGMDSSTLTIFLEDMYGNVVPNHAVSIDYSGISVSITPPSPYTTDENGEATFQVTSLEDGSVVFYATILPEDITLTLPAIEFFGLGGPTDPTKTEYDFPCCNLEFIADGENYARLRVRIKDSEENGLPNHEITFNVSGSQNLYCYVEDGNDEEVCVATSPTLITSVFGYATVNLKTTLAEEKTVTITDHTSGITWSLPPEYDYYLPLRFVAGPPSLENSTLEVTPQIVIADGVSTATITATIVDNYNNPNPDAQVNLRTTGNAVIEQLTNFTDANGQIFGTVKNGTAEDVIISAYLVRVEAELTNKSNVSFQSVDLAVTITGTDQVAPGGRLQYEINVENVGNLSSTDTTLTLALPAGLSFDSHTATVDPTVNQENVVTWSFGDLPPTEPPTEPIAFSVTVNADENLFPETILTSSLTATTSAFAFEINTDNNQGQASTTVVSDYDFDISLTPESPKIIMGGDTSLILH